MDHEQLKETLLRDPEVKEAYDNPPLAFVIASAVIDLRRAAGFTQEELAKELGTSQNQIWRIESGDKNISTKTIHQLQERFGLRFTAAVPTMNGKTPTPFKRRRRKLSTLQPA